MAEHPSDHVGDLSDDLKWRISSFSGDQGSCVELALARDGRVAVRNSNDRDAGTVFFTRREMEAWVRGAKAGEFDDLT
jgi:phosphoribosyl-AMP cyclohydrolase